MHVILLAFGVSKTTRKAAQRLLRMTGVVDGVTVVRAAGFVKLGSGMIPGVEIAEATGSDGVRVVAAAQQGQVLLVHDDVLVTRPTLEKMIACHREVGGVVAPYSNERAPDQFIGSLPAARDAEAEVHAVARKVSRRTVHEARFSCLVSDGVTFSDCGGSLVMPGSALVRTDVHVTLAQAVVAHDMECARLGSIDVEAPLLVASMIVRDEQEMLPDALESVRDLVDRIEICDTGSVDRTVELAREAGAIVTEIEWRDDFSWARNQALDRCRDAVFALLFDADERITIDDPDTFRSWLAAWSDEIDGLTVEVRSERSDEGEGTAVTSVRVARAEVAYFEGAIHEVLRIPVETRDKPNVVYHRGMKVTHKGYREDVITDKNKADRNVTIARAAYDNDPTVKSKIDLARSLRMDDPDDPEAEELFRSVLEELTPDHQPKVWSFVRAVVGAYEMVAGRLDRALDLSLQAIEGTSGEDVALLTIGYCYSNARQFSQLVAFDESRCQRAFELPMFQVARNIRRYEVQVARAHLELGNLEEGHRRLVEALAKDPAGVGDLVGEAMPKLLEADPDDSILLPLVAGDPSGSVLAVVARSVPAERTAQLSLAALEMGSEFEHLVITGLTAALVKQSDPLIEMALNHVELVGADRLTSLVDLAVRRQRADVAERLRRHALRPVGAGLFEAVAAAS